MNETKICWACKKEKPIGEFYRHKQGKRAYSGSCISCNRDYSRQWQQNHREQAKEARRQLKEEVLRHYSGGRLCCAKCRFDDIRALTIDHCNGNGNKHRKSIGKQAGRQFYLWLKQENYPSGFQVLCMNCQFISAFPEK